MTVATKPEKPTILWVDHQKDSVQGITKKIGSLGRARIPTEEVLDSYDLVPLAVTPGRRLEERVYEAIDGTGPCRPSLILVDLNFTPRHPPEGVMEGRKLALGLLERLRTIPVGVYTRHFISHRQRAEISTDGLAAVLEDIAKMYEGPTQLTGDDWVDLFNRIISKAEDAAKTPVHVLATPPIDSVAIWDTAQPLHRSRSFMEAAPVLVTRALEWLDPPATRIVLTQLSGGFSGSYVVKARLEDRNKAFVIKIDEDPTRIARELEGYNRVESLLNRRFYLPVSNHHKNQPVTLAKNWWGAFAMEYEGDAAPLVEQSHMSGEQLATVYETLWRDCLTNLYLGKPDNQVTTQTGVSIRNILSSDTVGFVNQSSKTLKRYAARLSVHDNYKPCIDRASALLRDYPDDSFVHNTSIRAPWVERVHGDLNCRNVLYDKRQGDPLLIDFPNIGPSSCLCVDFVKAEAELVLIMMDWSTGWDCDFGRIDLWGALTEGLSSSFVPNDVVVDDPEIMRVLTPIKRIREMYSALANGVGEPAASYRLYLLRRVMRYVGYSDLTIAKRYLALLWAGQLLVSPWDEVPPRH